MNKEKIKTLLLTSLVISSIVLTMQIWFNGKLWSEDYDFFSAFKEKITSVIKGSKDSVNINDTGALDSIFAPKTILISTSDGRYVSDASTPEGKKIVLALNSVIKSAISAGDSKEVSEDDFKNTIKVTGIYADYSVPVSVSAIAAFLNTDNIATENINSFDKILIDCDKISQKYIPVYFRDSETLKHYRVDTPFDKSVLFEFINNPPGQDLNLSYSFELGLDKKATGDGNFHQSIFLDSYILLSLDEVYMGSIREENMDITSMQSVEKIADSLGYNLNTVRRYTLTDGTMNFVDSKSTLTISPKGYIEYKASEDMNGIKIGDDGSITTAAAGSASLMDKILSNFEINEKTKLFISTPLTENNDSYKLKFNYLYDTAIIRGDEDDCFITVKDGRITYFKLFIKNFVISEEGDPSNVLDIIEKVYEKSGYKSGLVIKQLYTGYIKKGGIYKKVWFANIDGELTTIG